MSKEARTLRGIAAEIMKEWPKVREAKPEPFPGYGPIVHPAWPYLEAMAQLASIESSCGQDSGHSVVAYFLSNARSWRGEAAKRIKAELKAML